MNNYKKDLFEGLIKNSDKISQRNNQQRQIKLSPSSLNLFLECQRCFWLYVNKDIKRPSRPVATITTGLDRVIKEHLNQYRQKNTLPPFLEGKIKGKLMVEFPKRGWLEYTDKKISAKLIGYLDECIEFEDKHYAVLDHKTRGTAPENVHEAYQFQMDAYTFLLEENNFPSRKIAYLAYYIPKKIVSGSDFQFEVLIKEIATDPKRAKDIFYKAIECLNSSIPSIKKDCEFCQWTSTINIK